MSPCLFLCLSVYIYMYVPVYSRAADVLLSGAVMNRVFQPHEVHIPYVLQVSFTFRTIQIFSYVAYIWLRY